MGRHREAAAEAAGGYSYITITSDSRVMIEGCRQIIDCSDVMARVLTRRFIVEIWGSGLHADSFSNGSVAVSGRITQVTLERKRSSGEV